MGGFNQLNMNNYFPVKASIKEPCNGRKAISIHVSGVADPDTGMAAPVILSSVFGDSFGSIQGLFFNPFDAGATAGFNVFIESTGQVVSLENGQQGYIPLLGFDSSQITITPMSSGNLGCVIFLLNYSPDPYIWNAQS